MDDLAFLRERIESYADYTNDDDRRLADEQIRAYAGERLARLGERIGPTGPAADALSRLVLRCQFADQSVIHALDVDDLDAAAVAAIHTSDREVVELAERAETAAAADVATVVASLDRALDRRAQLIVGSVTAAKLPPQ